MNKKTIKNIFNWLKDAWLKAFAVFLILTAGFYAYAQITWPGSDPNPTTGVVGLFVGESDAAFNSALDYNSAYDYCANTTGLEGSHICTPMEMMNSYNHGNAASPINTYSASSTLWVNMGTPGYVANSNDCVAWTKTTAGTDPQNPNYGAIWNFNVNAGGLSPCKTGRKFACCK